MTQRLPPPLFGHRDPVVVGTQSVSAEPFALGQVVDFLRTNDSMCTIPVSEFSRQIDTSPTVAAQSVEDLVHRSTSSDNPRKRKRSSNSSQSASELMVRNLSQNVLCKDYYSLLESELPRWTREGLWHEMPQNISDPDSSTMSALPLPSSYSKLERAYLTVCQLNARMGDDMVRNRIALIQLYLEYTEIQQGQRKTSPSNRAESTVGRGYASQAIDTMLEKIHEGWGTLNQQRRAELRAKFHERKKYGKRWSQLTNALGPGILLVCSTKLASAV